MCWFRHPPSPKSLGSNLGQTSLFFIVFQRTLDEHYFSFINQIVPTPSRPPPTPRVEAQAKPTTLAGLYRKRKLQLILQAHQSFDFFSDGNRLQRVLFSFPTTFPRRGWGELTKLNLCKQKQIIVKKYNYKPNLNKVESCARRVGSWKTRNKRAL